MKSIKLISFLLLAVGVTSCTQSLSQIDALQEIKVEQCFDTAGFRYETVVNDPTGLRLYTLKNGLKVYLAKNEEEPKIQTIIAVKAGSTYDPIDNTGLAHYLEHMLFKGTDEIGTQDFKKEKVFLKKISDLYEKHRLEPDTQKKRNIYKNIDKISQEASKIAVANEYQCFYIE
jgi:zinc protease